MHRGSPEIMCRQCKPTEDLKIRIRPIVEEFGRQYNDPARRVILFNRPFTALTNVTRLINREKSMSARVAKAQWRTDMIADAAQNAPRDGVYDVVLVRHAGRTIVIDLFCCMFLDRDWNLEMCFIDVYQVRSIQAPSGWYFANPKIQESKQRLVEDLLQDADFEQLMRSAFNHPEIQGLINSNVTFNRPRFLGTCSRIAQILTTSSATLSEKFYIFGVSGKWNLCTGTNWLNTHWKDTNHDWLMIRDLKSMEVVAFDPSFYQFIGRASVPNLATALLDVGQMRSVGLTEEEKETKWGTKL